MSVTSHKGKVLLVDDDPDFLAATTKTLKEDGYEVASATTGGEALKKAREEAPSLMILDLMLPDADGFSVCSQLKDDVRTSAIPILILTGVPSRSTSYLKDISLYHRADDYAQKPVRRKQFLKKVDRLISGARQSLARSRTTVLIADDDPDFVLTTRRFLQANGYRTLVAKNGNECLRMAQDAVPDMIILDVMFPDKDGFTVCAELKEKRRTRAIPVLLSTAIGEQIRKSDFACEVAVQHQADDYIDKPIRPSDLLKKVRRHTRTGLL